MMLKKPLPAFCKTKKGFIGVPFVVPASAGFVRSFSDDFAKRMSLKLPTNPHKCGTTNNKESLAVRTDVLRSYM